MDYRPRSAPADTQPRALVVDDQRGRGASLALALGVFAAFGQPEARRGSLPKGPPKPEAT